MIEWVIYWLEINGIFVILYGLYRLGFRKMTFHQANRIVLLGILFIALCCPAVELVRPIEADPIFITPPILEIDSEEVIPSVPESNAESVPAGVSFLHLVFIIWLIGVMVRMARFVLQVWSLMRLRRRSEPEKWGKYVVIPTSHPEAPFSFFSWMFIPSQWRLKPGLEPILEHESTHIQQWHSLDTLVAELALALLWINPVVFYWRRSLQEVHEFLADEQVLRKMDTPDRYLSVLWEQIAQSRGSQLRLNFTNSSLKNRILMITRHKTTNWKQVAYFLWIPVMLLLIQSFSVVYVPMEAQPAEKAFLTVLPIDPVPSILPIAEESLIRMSSGFGERMDPFSKKMKFHHGMDFVAKDGTPVLATADGMVETVSYSGDGIGHGRKVVIKHSGTYSTAYSQLSGFNVVEGQRVAKGDVIGYVGSSGLSTGPHLHYEVWKNGAHVDPKDYF